MRAVYRNPMELASAMKDMIDLHLDGLMSYDKLELRISKMVEENGERFIKNGFIPVKISNVLGQERIDIINKIIEDSKSNS